MRRGQQVLGLGILLFAFAPLYRVMDTSAEAPHREVSVEVAEVTLQLAWWGTIVTVLLAWTLARLFRPGCHVWSAGASSSGSNGHPAERSL